MTSGWVCFPQPLRSRDLCLELGASPRGHHWGRCGVTQRNNPKYPTSPLGWKRQNCVTAAAAAQKRGDSLTLVIVPCYFCWKFIIFTPFCCRLCHPGAPKGDRNCRRHQIFCCNSLRKGERCSGGSELRLLVSESLQIIYYLLFFGVLVDLCGTGGSEAITHPQPSSAAPSPAVPELSTP